ncbi:cation diffusion facilitator family transporter [Chlamydiales bacterium]|nr:cation diffusion facilitator family transporter [Chlamydiales bacterium]
MSTFPGPVLVPDSVPEQRKERLKQLMRTISMGLSVKSLIILIEFFGFYFFGGHALLLDAISSLIDLGTSLCLLIFVWIASKPPDSNHPFGHGRLEPLAGMQLALFLSLMGLGLFIQQMMYLFQEPAKADIAKDVWIVPLVAVVLLEIAYRRMLYIAKKEHSPALKADAIHYRIDAINSLIASFALLMASFIPEYNGWIDRIGAILIAFLMILMGIRAARENFHQVTDRKPDSPFFERVKNAAHAVAGVLEIEKINIQMYGPDAHVDIDIEVKPSERVDRAHEIAQEVRVAIQKSWPQVRDVTVHIEPFYPNKN